jgi:hypothetical protein
MLRRIITLSAIVFCSIGSSLAHAAPDACALLTVAELSAAVGQTVLGGNPSHTGDGGGQCMYGYGTLNQIGIELWQFPSAADAQKRFSEELKDSKAHDKGSHKTTVESGVGDRAFSTTGVVGTMKAATWVSVRGSRVLHIVTLGENAVPQDRLHRLMLAALAR